jgi:hypothetical protein
MLLSAGVSCSSTAVNACLLSFTNVRVSAAASNKIYTKFGDAFFSSLATSLINVARTYPKTGANGIRFYLLN